MGELSASGGPQASNLRYVVRLFGLGAAVGAGCGGLIALALMVVTFVGAFTGPHDFLDATWRLVVLKAGGPTAVASGAVVGLVVSACWATVDSPFRRMGMDRVGLTVASLAASIPAGVAGSALATVFIPDWTSLDHLMTGGCAGLVAAVVSSLVGRRSSAGRGALSGVPVRFVMAGGAIGLLAGGLVGWWGQDAFQFNLPDLAELDLFHPEDGIGDGSPWHAIGWSGALGAVVGLIVSGLVVVAFVLSRRSVHPVRWTVLGGAIIPFVILGAGGLVRARVAVPLGDVSGWSVFLDRRFAYFTGGTYSSLFPQSLLLALEWGLSGAALGVVAASNQVRHERPARPLPRFLVWGAVSGALVGLGFCLADAGGTVLSFVTGPQSGRFFTPLNDHEFPSILGAAIIVGIGACAGSLGGLATRAVLALAGDPASWSASAALAAGVAFLFGGISLLHLGIFPMDDRLGTDGTHVGFSIGVTVVVMIGAVVVSAGPRTGRRGGGGMFADVETQPSAEGSVTPSTA